MTDGAAGPTRVRVRRLENGRDLALPEPATSSSSACDLRAAVTETTVLEAGCYLKVPTGLAIELPPGWEAQVRPRSGLAARHGVTLLNSPGTVDADYRGEIAVLLINHGSQPFEIRRGDRIAQLVVSAVAPVVWEEVDELGESERGCAGFGSSGRS